MDSNDVRFPWEDPDEAAAQPAPEPPATASDQETLAGAAHAELTEQGQAEEDAAGVEERDPWNGGAPAVPDELEPWATPSAAGPTGTDEGVGAAATGAPSAEGGGSTRDRPIAPKEYYSISEVCDLVDLKPHVLRYWETQFAVLNPSKNRSGNRVYQRKEIKLIQLVKHLLYDEKYTVEGAKQKLDQTRKSGELPAATRRALDRQTLDMLRSELRRLSELLAAPEST